MIPYYMKHFKPEWFIEDKIERLFETKEESNQTKYEIKNILEMSSWTMGEVENWLQRLSEEDFKTKQKEIEIMYYNWKTLKRVLELIDWNTTLNHEDLEKIFYKF